MTNSTSTKDENKLLNSGVQYFLGIFLIQLILLIFAYFGFLRHIDGFIVKYGWWLFYLILTISALAIALWSFYAYKTKVNCMTGMMIGMTFGMQTGMMIGIIFGATNGFLMGCVIGMITAITVGVITGKCCGIMGIMEGMMAGVMSGTMGPMIAIMMMNDHLLLFMPIFMLANLCIIAGLCYMLYQELGKKENCDIKELDFITLASLAVIFLFVFVVIMLFGYKSAVAII